MVTRMLERVPVLAFGWLRMQKRLRPRLSHLMSTSIFVDLLGLGTAPISVLFSPVN